MRKNLFAKTEGTVDLGWEVRWTRGGGVEYDGAEHGEAQHSESYHGEAELNGDDRSEQNTVDQIQNGGHEEDGAGSAA